MKKFIPELSAEEAETFSSYTTYRKVPQGAILHGFSSSKDLYFLDEGCIEICNSLYVEGQKFTVHLSRMHAPHILGESSFMLENREDTIAITSTPCSYYHLTEASLKKLKEEEPAIAIKLLEFSGKEMAERLQKIHNRIFKNIASRSKNIHLTVELMKRFVGHTSPCSKEIEKKLFKPETTLKRKPFLEDLPKKAV